MIWASVKRSLFIRISSILTLRKFSFKSHSFYGGITVLPKLDDRLPPDVKFRICGYLNPEVDVSRLVLNPRVEIVGRVNEVTPYYDTHRIFVAPTRFAGGIPYKIHEAAAHGLPIVASDILCEQVGWQAGEDMLAPATGNAASFADAIVSLYDERELWQKLRYNALRRIARENNAEAYTAEIRNILSQFSQQSGNEVEGFSLTS